MKTLYLFRHCKSDWSADFQRDFDRPLNERGRGDAPMMCDILRSVLSPSETCIASSPSVRTRQTIEPLIQHWSEARRGAIDWNENLYESGRSAYMEVIKETPDTFDNLLIVGHNPSIQDTTEFLVSGHRLDELVHVATGTLLCLTMNLRSWKQAGADHAIIRWMLTPRIVKKVRQV
ncbi:phosphohistidine phosphatase [Cyclonatronum proteinivorum]|uniref:Phosphohistidine phosphatase n=1 Tax=Cyclonatronum proteinivorum TaxID=1457365 RepID=A0A345UGT3_9BACT|nr:histidine phosphatase family protein [Cyclonatronum proteinivorum]AXI99684.1 phosphohistidine phosphatase [Cyclonatronum proteinivorum]